MKRWILTGIELLFTLATKLKITFTPTPQFKRSCFWTTKNCRASSFFLQAKLTKRLWQLTTLVLTRKCSRRKKKFFGPISGFHCASFQPRQWGRQSCKVKVEHTFLSGIVGEFYKELAFFKPNKQSYLENRFSDRIGVFGKVIVIKKNIKIQKNIFFKF